jgi:lauroyl/myristoyl acyltransferase
MSEVTHPDEADEQVDAHVSRAARKIVTVVGQRVRQAPRHYQRSHAKWEGNLNSEGKEQRAVESKDGLK